VEAFDLWRESTRRYHQRRREQHRWEWIRHFDKMADSHARISEDYRRRADELVKEPTPAPACAREGVKCP
jgi:hypothetical protein